MSKISRRQFITTGLAATAGLSGLAAAHSLVQRYGLVPPDSGGIYGPGETLTYAAQRVLARAVTTGTEQEEKSTQGGAAAIAAVPRPSSPASAKAVLITGREPHQIEDSQAVYGHQPQIGASSDALAAFYGGDRTRILIAAVFYAIHQPRSATRQLFQPLTPGKYAI